MMDNVNKGAKIPNRQKLDKIDSVIRDFGNDAKVKIEKRLHELNEEIEYRKGEGYKGTINPKDYTTYYITDKDIFKLRIEPSRNDIYEVSDNQYKIIYDKNYIDFEIEPNTPFYQDSEEFKNKKKLTKFLNNSKKVNINPDMFFIPFKYKNDNKFYILVVNNILENIEVYQLNSLNQLNNQHNVYDIIKTNKDDKIKDPNSFKIYIIRTCQKYIKHNNKQLYNVYATISHFKNEEAIIKQF